MYEIDEIKETEFETLAQIYKLFGSVPRLKMLLALNEKECSAGELMEACGLSQSATSHQLKELKQCRIVKAKKVGMNIYYSLDDSHIVDIIKSGMDHVKGDHCNE